MLNVKVFRVACAFLIVGVCCCWTIAQPVDVEHNEQKLSEYFRIETENLEQACLTNVGSIEDWEKQRPELRRQLLEMLGLEPLPERTGLQANVTATTEHDQFTVERIHFQSRPGLYVTANLYAPRTRSDGERLPAILYVCGHGRVKKDGISYGNKVHYHHHGSWFARHGYVCLTIDSLQLGEIEAIHHGTYRYDMWWWLNRGYTPAGVEAWNCIRALDYLQSRDEVDPERIGVTGRSGGGAYSWWIAAIDDRIKVAVPVAGITDLRNHVMDGCVEGHCDCMYFVNTYRWDYPLLAALVAPRPLLISNTDRDSIFPLDGVVRTHAKARNIYELHDADDKLALHITAGPHKDTQELRVHAFRWFDKHLKDSDELLEAPAVSFFEPEQLRVLETLPDDQVNTEIQETFVATKDDPKVPRSEAQWLQMRSTWMKALRTKVFAGWPAESEGLNVTTACQANLGPLHVAGYDFTSQHPHRLRLMVARRADLENSSTVILHILSQNDWSRIQEQIQHSTESIANANSQSPPIPELFSPAISGDTVLAFIAPRGIGPTAWSDDQRKQTQIRRRFYLLGQTLDGMRVWDIRRAIRALRTLDVTRDARLSLEARGVMATLAVYACVFESDVAELRLHELPNSLREGPFLLNASRVSSFSRVIAMAAERSQIETDETNPALEYARRIQQALNWPERVSATRH